MDDLDRILRSHADRLIQRLHSIPQFSILSLQRPISVLHRLITAGVASYAQVCSGLARKMCTDEFYAELISRILLAYRLADTIASISMQLSSENRPKVSPPLRLMLANLLRVLASARNVVADYFSRGLTLASAHAAQRTMALVETHTQKKTLRRAFRGEWKAVPRVYAELEALLDVLISRTDRRSMQCAVLTLLWSRSVEALLAFVLQRRLRVDSAGVRRLEAAASCLAVQWLTGARRKLGLDSSQTLLVDTAVWRRLRAVLLLLRCACIKADTGVIGVEQGWPLSGEETGQWRALAVRPRLLERLMTALWRRYRSRKGAVDVDFDLPSAAL